VEEAVEMKISRGGGLIIDWRGIEGEVLVRGGDQ
jgi:hypothetical protein